MNSLAEFFNASLCVNGRLEKRSLYIDLATGLIAAPPSNGTNRDDNYMNDRGVSDVSESYDLRGHIVAPAFIDVHCNGAGGFSFDPSSSFSADGVLQSSYPDGLKQAAKNLLAHGTGSFLATIPTLKADAYQKILPELRSQSFGHGAELLGAHCEGPWLNPSQSGGHDSTLMQLPSKSTPEEIFGETEMESIKIITLAPELPEAMDLITRLVWGDKRIIAMGHSNAGVNAARFAELCGASCISNVFYAMGGVTTKDPGLASWIASPSAPYFTLTADGRKIHPYLVSMAFRSNPERCVLVTDSSPLVGLPDGIYQSSGGPGLRHVLKRGNKLLHRGTEGFIGPCVGIDECVRNLVKFARCTLAESVRCATENAAKLLGLTDRGVLEIGRRADFVILDEAGNIVEVWQAGRCTFRAGLE